MEIGEDNNALADFSLVENQLLANESLAVVAHELKAPLCLIRQLSLFLEDNLSSGDSKVRSYLKQITAVSDRGLRLANDLTRSGKLSQMTFELEPISPTETCRQVIQEMSGYYQINQRRIRLRTERRQHYLATANRELVKSILVNFCDNALHYADGNQPVEINVSLNKKKEKVRISVRDYGPRLPLDIWRSLKKRQPLQPQSIASRPMSSGLGLYLADQFAQAMKADIGAITHQDGATLYLDLNLSKQLSLL